MSSFKAVVVGPLGRRVSKVKVDVRPVIKRLAAVAPQAPPRRKRKPRT